MGGESVRFICSEQIFNIGITPNQTMVYAEFYHGLLPETMVKFCVYRGLGGGYSYSNMTNYFKMHNYCKFYCKMFIVTTAIMSDNRELPGYAVFYQGTISSFSQSESRTPPCHVRIHYYKSIYIPIAQI